MLFFNRLGKAAFQKPRVVAIGWVIQTDRAAFIWPVPRAVTRPEPTARHAKSALHCPAIADHETRLFEVVCPFDLRLRFHFDEKGEPAFYDVSGDQSGMRPQILSRTVTLSPRKEWRHPDRPIIQIFTPYRFFADEAVYMTQMPPFLHYRDPPWPGILVGGRFPIHIWPRRLMWAFEWHDTDKDLVLTRGEPWFYTRFELSDGASRVRIVEAEMTSDLMRYFSGIDGVVGYVNRTFSLFTVAEQRRPARLLIPRRSSVR